TAELAWRCWRAYHQRHVFSRGPRWPLSPREHFAMAREVEDRAWQSTLAFWNNRDRRSLAANRYFRRLRGPGVMGHAVTDLDRDTVAALVADPDAPFRRPGVRLLKDSRSSTVAEL